MSDRWLSSFDAKWPVLLATRWAPSDRGTRPKERGLRMPPRGRHVVVLEVEATPGAGLHRLQIFLVQEGVRWFGGEPRRPLAEVLIAIRP